MALKQGITFNGKKFLYEGSISSSLNVYPLKNNSLTGTIISISPEIIEDVKSTIANRGEIQMGACYDNPSPNSLGAMLKQNRKSPLLLSYILPLLEEEGFLIHYKDGNAYWVRKSTINESVGVNSEKTDRPKKRLVKMGFHIPNKKDFLYGSKMFEKETRGAIYKVSTFLVSHYWGKPRDMADALGVLLLVWNQAFYRYGPFSYEDLEQCISTNLENLEKYRGRNIFNLSGGDEQEIKEIFEQFLMALRIISGKKKNSKSPVSAAKALHLLAPEFFPLWDDKIAKAYRCYYNQNPSGKYIEFCHITKSFAEKIKGYKIRSDKTLLKLIDEYNYSKYTKGWIK